MFSYQFNWGQCIVYKLSIERSFSARIILHSDLWTAWALGSIVWNFLQNLWIKSSSVCVLVSGMGKNLFFTWKHKQINACFWQKKQFRTTLLINLGHPWLVCSLIFFGILYYDWKSGSLLSLNPPRWFCFSPTQQKQCCMRGCVFFNVCSLFVLRMHISPNRNFEEIYDAWSEWVLFFMPCSSYWK